SSSPGDQGGTQPETDHCHKMDNGPAASSGASLSTSTADPGGDDTNNGSAVAPKEGINTGTNGQGNSPEKRQSSPISVANSEGEQRGPVSAPDAKPHGTDSPSSTSEEFHSLVSVGGQELEPHNRSQSGVQTQQQNGTMEAPGQRLLQERLPLTEVFPRP